MTRFKLLLVFVTTLTIVACKKTKEGCTDLNASNYSADAVKDDGGCEYPPYPISGLGLTPGCTNCATLSVMKTYTSASAYYPTAFAYFIHSGDMLASAGNLQLRTTNQVGAGNSISVLDFSKTAGYYDLPLENDVDLNKFFFEWSAAGSSKWPAFNVVDSVYSIFPDMGTYSGLSSISSSADYTFTMNSVTNCDSVIFALYGTSGQIIKTEPANAISSTFSSAELNQVGQGTAQLTVRGMKESTQTVNGKTYKLSKQVYRSVSNLTITF